MARQPDYPIPFEPRGLGITPTKKPPVVTDDRRDWFSTLAGLNHSNEVYVPPTGYWTSIDSDPGRNITEVLRVLLPRPEPITLTFAPYQTAYQQNKFRRPAHFFSQTWPVNELAVLDLGGRIFVEWGTGQSRAWTYFDAGAGSLHLPSVSDVRVSGWSYSAGFWLAANAQIGYAHGDHYCTWTFIFIHNPASTFTNARTYPPPFSRELTSYFAAQPAGSTNSSAIVAVEDISLNKMGEWSLRPVPPPNQPSVPYAPRNVLLAPGVNSIYHDLTVVDSTDEVITSVVKIKI